MFELSRLKSGGVASFRESLLVVVVAGIDAVKLSEVEEGGTADRLVLDERVQNEVESTPHTGLFY